VDGRGVHGGARSSVGVFFVVSLEGRGRVAAVEIGVGCRCRDGVRRVEVGGSWNGIQDR